MKSFCSFILLSAVICLGSASSIPQADGTRPLGGSQVMATGNDPNERTVRPVVSMIGIPAALLKNRAGDASTEEATQPEIPQQAEPTQDTPQDGPQQQQQQQQQQPQEFQQQPQQQQMQPDLTRVKRQFDWSKCWSCGDGKSSSRIVISGPGVKAGPCGPLVDPLPGSGGGKKWEPQPKPKPAPKSDCC